jgi:ribulose-phosphate 3-epimerase
MSVNPGFGGQQFIPNSYKKISELRHLINDRGLKVKIEVDGGVTIENAKALVDAGVDVLVAGNTVFASDDPAETIKKLKAVA